MSQATSTTAGSEDWSIQRVLTWTIEHLKKQGIEAARLESEILLAHAMGLPRIQLYTRFQQVLTPEQRQTMRELVQRRVKREPVAYLVGYREFFSLKFMVNSHVLIPRPDTETLVLEVIKHARQAGGRALNCLDLCTGSGCIAVACAKQIANSTWTLTDKSKEALEIAAKNVASHQLESRCQLVESDLFLGLPAEAKYDVIVTNPPYIPTAEIKELDKDVRDYEPGEALDGGADGLNLIRKIVEELPQRLVSGGLFICEFSPEQVSLVEGIVKAVFPQGKITMIKDASQQWRAVSLLLPAV